MWVFRTPKVRRRLLLPAAGGAAIVGLIALRDNEDITVKAGEFKPQLPTFTMQQVAATPNKTLVVYRHGVYDVTEFAQSHPGGSKILQAAGKSLELFWQQSEPHSRSGVAETLEELRIGTLRRDDFDKMEEVKTQVGGIGANGCATAVLQQFFFIEKAAPEVDSEAFELKISGAAGEEEISMSLAELKTKFKQHQVTTTTRCASPRSVEASNSKVTARVPAKWTGVLLVDVLASVGVNTAGDVEIVQFEALDTDTKGRPFGASIAATTALDRDVGVLLAYEMNGAPIPKEHGFPLRVVVPGTTGVRNVKFVHRIVIT